MILPKTEYPLLDFAEQSEVSQSLILQFIEKGGAEYLNNVFVAYAKDELIKKSFLDNMTPVGGLDLGREIMAGIFNNFQKQFNEKNQE